MSDSKQRKLGAILSYIAIITTTIIQLLYTPFLIHKLGQSEYGLYSLVNSIVGYLTVLDLGFGNAIIVYTAKYRATGDIDSERKLHGMFKIIFYIIGFIAIFLGISLFLSVDKIFGNTMTDVELNKTKIMMLILTFNLGITFFFNIYLSIINAYEKFVFQKLLSIISTIVKPLLMIPLLLLDFKSITMVLIVTLVNTFIMISNYLYCRIKLKVKIKYNGFDNILFKTILGYSIWIFLGIIVDKINWSIDNFVLGAVSGTTAVSVYSVAAQLNTMFVNLSTAISGVLLPKISKMVAKKSSSKELTAEFIKVGRLQYYLIFLMCSGLIIFGRQFISFWVGNEYIDSYYVALIIIIPVCIPLIQNLGLSIIQAMNKYKFRSIIMTVVAIINLISSIFLAKMYGPIGAAIGTGASLIICNGIIMNIYYHKKIKIDIIDFWKNIAIMTSIFLIPVALILLVMIFVNSYNIFLLFSLIILYCLLFAIVCYCFVMNKYEKDIIISVFNSCKGIIKK